MRVDASVAQHRQVLSVDVPFELQQGSIIHGRRVLIPHATRSEGVDDLHAGFRCVVGQESFRELCHEDLCRARCVKGNSPCCLRKPGYGIIPLLFQATLQYDDDRVNHRFLLISGLLPCGHPPFAVAAQNALAASEPPMTLRMSASSLRKSFVNLESMGLKILAIRRHTWHAAETLKSMRLSIFKRAGP